MTPTDVELIDHGLYIILWATGGYSLAAVGSDDSGKRWFAATNWVSGPSFDWSDVSAVVPVLTKAETFDDEPGVTDDGLDVAIDAWMVHLIRRVGDAEAIARLGHESPAGLVRLAERLHRRGAINEARAIYQEASCVTPGIGTLVRVFNIALKIAKPSQSVRVNSALIDLLVSAVTPVVNEEPA